MLLAPRRSRWTLANLVMRLFLQLLPVTPLLHGQQFLVTLDGRRHATPLLVALRSPSSAT
ncbi:MAG: hypothetical protein U0P30_17185 [Vicinamibacterales bacterium]